MNTCETCLTEYDGRICPERKCCVITRPGFYTLVHQCDKPLRRVIDRAFPGMKEGTHEDWDGAVLEFEEITLTCALCGAKGVYLVMIHGRLMCGRCRNGKGKTCDARGTKR